MSDTAEYSFWDRHLITLESDAKRVLLPAIRNVQVVTVICPRSPDVKVAIELGMAIYLDKLILLLVPPGRHVTDHLRRVADEIIDVPEDARTWAPLVDMMLTKMIKGTT